MQIEYDDGDRAREVAERARSFVESVVIPVEREHLGSGPIPESVVEGLREEARAHDVYAPQVDEEYGGLGLDFRDVLPTFEAAGRSLLGPAALRIAAPDEGNMNTLELFGTDEQKERWLRPLVADEIRSAISMTEPMQGGGSDPKMLKTVAERDSAGETPTDSGETSASRDGDEWVIDGHKWWTTRGSEADVLLVLARTDFDAHPYEGCSFILVPADAPGVEIVRDIPHMGGTLLGETHAEIVYDDVRVPVENTLGPVNEGFSVVQRRLGPARLTHCMRYAGMAERALDVAKAYASERRAFDEPLAEKQGLRFEIAEAETRLHAARTMVRHAARAIERGEEARVEVAMCKSYVAPVVQEAIDVAVQVCGANGIGRDLPLADFYETVRQFRILDGADEVHKRSIARAAFDGVDESELEAVTRYRDAG